MPSCTFLGLIPLETRVKSCAAPNHARRWGKSSWRSNSPFLCFRGDWEPPSHSKSPGASQRRRDQTLHRWDKPNGVFVVPLAQTFPPPFPSLKVSSFLFVVPPGSRLRFHPGNGYFFLNVHSSAEGKETKSSLKGAKIPPAGEGLRGGGIQMAVAPGLCSGPSRGLRPRGPVGASSPPTPGQGHPRERSAVPSPSLCRAAAEPGAPPGLFSHVTSGQSPRSRPAASWSSWVA